MSMISGYVYDKNGNPLERLVRAYRRVSGALAGEAISNATTGEYTISLYHADMHYVVVVDGTYSEADVFWDNVVLGLHMEGLEGGTTFTDVRGKGVDLHGTVCTSTAQKIFGAGSGYFDGSTAYLEVSPSPDFTFGTADFTLDMWVYIAEDSLPALGDSKRRARLISNYINTNVAGAFSLEIKGDTATTGTGIELNMFDGATQTYKSVGWTGTVSKGVWHHLEMSRVAGVCRLFLDAGALSATDNIGATEFTPCNYPLRIGRTANENYPSALNGYLADLRITKGRGRHTTSFLLPTAAFPHALSVSAGDKNAIIQDLVTPST
jgi:hypothetical protein